VDPNLARFIVVHQTRRGVSASAYLSQNSFNRFWLMACMVFGFV
jgi:hypothetical protein